MPKYCLISYNKINFLKFFTYLLIFREEHRLRVFENRVLRGIFGPKREEDGSWRWAGHVARMGDGRGVYRVLVESPKARDHWEDLGVGGSITLR
jgi:hypothetical protein